jgi:moderate conductance mechanosensitive channel
MSRFFNEEFWAEAGRAIANWLITDLPGLLIIIFLFFIALRLIAIGTRKLKKVLVYRAEKSPNVDTSEASKRITTLTSIIYKVFIIILIGVFFMLILEKVGVNIGPILASVGIIGLAVGFGAQELVRDFISGFFILLENQIREGDVAVINGTGGLVESIDLRTITLRDVSGVVHIFQNGKINSLSNMTKEWSAIVLDIGVAYKEDVDRVMKLMKQVGDELQQDPVYGPDIIEEMEISGLNEFADSALIIRGRIKTKPIKQWGIGREYRRRLKILFDKENVEIPFPHTTVYWGEEINPLKLEVKKN